MCSIRIKNNLTLILAVWLGFGPTVFGVDTCPESHACCKTTARKSCCGETPAPVAPAPVCQCNVEVDQPLAGLKTVETAKRQSEQRAQLADRQPQSGWSFKPVEKIDRLSTVSPDRAGNIALFRLTLRWRC